MERPEKDNHMCMTHVIKSNGRKRKREESRKEVELLEQEISDLAKKKVIMNLPFKYIIVFSQRDFLR